MLGLQQRITVLSIVAVGHCALGRGRCCRGRPKVACPPPRASPVAMSLMVESGADRVCSDVARRGAPPIAARDRKSHFYQLARLAIALLVGAVPSGASARPPCECPPFPCRVVVKNVGFHRWAAWGHDMRMEATMGGIWIAMRVAMASPQCRL